MPYKAESSQSLLEHIKQNIGKLNVLMQWVVNESTGSNTMHVFSAAPSYQGVEQVDANSPNGQLCSVIVTAQYEAAAKLAAIRSVLTNQEVTLHLTRVGQGAFNNPPDVMLGAAQAVVKVIKGFRVKVCWHAFKGSGLFAQQLQKHMPGIAVDLLSAKEFLNA